MKKKIALVMAGVMMVASLAGCSSSSSSSATTESSSATTESAATEAPADALQLIIASNQTSLDNPYSFGMDEFKAVVEDISGGAIQVTVHKGTLGENESELIEKLEMGAAHMVVSSPGFMTSVGVPEIDIFSLNYLFDSFDHWESAVDGDFGDGMVDMILDQTSNSFRVMGYWSSSVRDYYGKKVITSPADLAGMTVRTQDSVVQQEFWSGCGAIPTSVAWGELYQALQQGVVDSAENDYTNFMQKDHHKTDNGKYVCETHHDFTTRLLLMNGNFYDSLTAEQQAWIDEACVAATAEQRAVVYRMFEESKEQVIADGAIVTEFADMDIDAFKEIAIPIQDEFAATYGMEDELAAIRAAA
ncbi:TRAP transporter substrate-binding protein [Chakrabartyella piscis]|uniref:TRAP transporter substrate-binding protein n=1 Tax=Chakrabartyella piscis TaxID=2918914 RepID=UPI002958C1FD|nr:TRAP transporter substrate-binding protein [Chakrabartyella piscis]